MKNRKKTASGGMSALLMNVCDEHLGQFRLDSRGDSMLVIIH